MQQQHQLQAINIHQLQEKCKSKRELYRFLSQNAKAFLPKIGAVNVYFFRQILKGIKEYLKRTDVKVSSVPHIEGLTVQDFLNYARQHPNHLRYLPEERDWVHLDRQWICDVLYTLDTENIQDMIDEAIKKRNSKIENSQNLSIQIKPEFAAALEQCLQFSSDKGRSVFLLKDNSKRKRTRQEIEEVRDEEVILKEDKQQFLINHKRLKMEKEILEQQLEQAENSQQIVNQLLDAGILNENGQIQLQQPFQI